MTARTPKTRAASPPAARGSAVPDADPAGTLKPPARVPATSSRQAVSPDSLPGGRPGPETTRPGPASVRAGDQTPAGASDNDSPPAGSRPALRGAEWRAAAAKASRRRPAKAAPRAAAKAPAIPLPPAVGASLTATAQCLSGCGWTAGPGDPEEVDKAAAAHTKDGHATNLFSEPAAGAA